MPSIPNNAINLFSTSYGVVSFDGVGAFTTVAPSASGNVLTSNGSKWVSSAPATSGTVTSVSVVSANGLAGTVATSTSTPAITLSTTITGVLSGNGTAITGSSITQFDVLVGGASNAISSVGPGTSGQILQSAGNAANPAYSTSTYPTTNAINTLLYASSANVMAALATATTAVLTTSSGVPTWASELSLALGGTNANLTASNGGIFYSTASAGAILSGTATASKMLLSGASTTPTWSTSTIPTSAGATANKVLLSDGTNYVLSTPTFPNASATTGNIIISDGTNWIASTPTYPAAAGSSGNVLTSNGTNWTSAAPATSGTVTSVSVVSANGFAGTVATATSTPAITLSTTITGVLSGNGTAISGSALTQHGVLIGGATNAITSSSVGATGTVLAGNTGSDPTFQTISSLGGITTITGNSGGAESPSSGNFNILGGTTGLTFAGTAATETLTGTLVVGNGGTGVTTMTTSYGTLVAGTTPTGAIQNAGTGTSGQIYKSNGSISLPTWVNPATVGGSLILISSQTASNSATISFTGLTNYTNLLLVMNSVQPVTNTAVLNLLVSQDGATYLTTGYTSGLVYNAYNTSVTSNLNSTAAFIISSSQSNSGIFSGSAFMHNLNLGEAFEIEGQSNWIDTTFSTSTFGRIGGQGPTGIVAIRLQFSSGNISTGTFTLYALAQS